MKKLDFQIQNLAVKELSWQHFSQCIEPKNRTAFSRVPTVALMKALSKKKAIKLFSNMEIVREGESEMCLRFSATTEAERS